MGELISKLSLLINVCNSQIVNIPLTSSSSSFDAAMNTYMLQVLSRCMAALAQVVTRPQTPQQV
jgi:hypothetical protein